VDLQSENGGTGKSGPKTPAHQREISQLAKSIAAGISLPSP
jgi:hypothetical protein